MTRRRNVILLCSPVMVASVLARAGWVIAKPNHVVVWNRSGHELHEMTLTVTPAGGQASTRWTLESLSDGGRLAARHGANDFAVDLTCVCDGVPLAFTKTYVDLWRGETWLLIVRAAGVVESEYASSLDASQK